VKIAIAGGTGLVGSKVVAKVRAAGHEPVVIARSHGTNLITGEGLLEALRDCHAVIDVSNVVTTRKKVSIDFFSRATTTLLRAARQADVDHLVTLSIVGCDAVDLGYYFGKRVQEELVEAGDVPWTILRATQFFEFAGQLADVSTDGDTVRLPHTLFRPQAADDVAGALAEIAVAAPVNGIVEQAGPEALPLDDFVREVLRARGDSRDVVTGPDARYFGAEVDDRSLVPHNGARVAPTRFEDWLSHSPAER
jgi:uncharacterized protein YbjT (DUF2867 family)